MLFLHLLPNVLSPLMEIGITSCKRLILEARFEKKKTEVPILGKTGRGNKSTGWSGTGSATFHYNTSIFRELMARYKNTGEDIYFDIQVTNEDPTSSVGRQTVILKGL